MTIDEAIEIIRDELRKGIGHGYAAMWLNAHNMAISALRAQQEVEKNEPLTLDELREMDGQPVWIDFILDATGEPISFWALVSVDEELDEIYFLNNLGGSSAYEEVWSDIRAVYRRPPESK